MLLEQDPITTEPTLKGEKGRAWLLKVLTDDEMAGWLVEVPEAHPALWHSYWISLRRHPTLDTAAGTHEIRLAVVNNGRPRQRMIDTGRVWIVAQAPKFAARFIAHSDAGAHNVIRATVHLVCDGKLAPDLYDQRKWVKLFGDNMLR